MKNAICCRLKSRPEKTYYRREAHQPEAENYFRISRSGFKQRERNPSRRCSFRYLISCSKAQLEDEDARRGAKHSSCARSTRLMLAIMQTELPEPSFRGNAIVPWPFFTIFARRRRRRLASVDSGIGKRLVGVNSAGVVTSRECGGETRKTYSQN